MVHYGQVIPFVEGFLNDLRKRGLAGNIVRDLPEQLEVRENASWTGKAHQLAFVGEATDYRLELRRFEADGSRVPIREERDPSKFNQLVIHFVVQEG